MLTWILGIILIIWIILKRFSNKGKVEGEPLTLPRGTIRGLITLLIVSFPLNNLLLSDNIPPLIINGIFILVAFYFEARRGIKEELIHVIENLQRPEKIDEIKRKYYPLYLPKYSVRISLIIVLIITLTYNALGPKIPFVTTNTLQDLLFIIILFIIGAILRAVGMALRKGKIRDEIEKISDYKALSAENILEKIALDKPSKWKIFGRSFISLLLLIAIVFALMLYSFNIVILTIPFINLSLRDTLLLLINVYYGFRD